jgi:hypothetical protein
MAVIPPAIASGAEPFYVLVISNDSGFPDEAGDAVTWETRISDGSTIDAVKDLQALLGTRYGPTLIAECRIITPESQP